MNIDFYMPTRVYSGEGCIRNNADVFLKYGNKCLVVTGRSSAKVSGALDDVLEILSASEIEYEIFDKVEQNPLTSTCKEAGDIACSLNARFIIGIGGGSVLDAAKAIAVFAENPLMSHTDIYSRKIPANRLPLILVGTTSGTGSEVTGVSVLTNSDTGLKKSISGADCYADISFCDYRYTESANNSVRISTALDAFCHAVEARVASSCNDIVSHWADKAIKILSPYILNGNFTELSHGDYEKLYIASIYAGFAINTAGTCFPHTVGYCLTEGYGISHGRACAVFMPLLLERTKKYCPERLRAILSITECSEKELSDAVMRLADVKASVSEEKARFIAERWKAGIRNFDRSPGGFSVEDAIKALCSLGK